MLLWIVVQVDSILLPLKNLRGFERPNLVGMMAWQMGWVVGEFDRVVGQSCRKIDLTMLEMSQVPIFLHRPEVCGPTWW